MNNKLIIKITLLLCLCILCALFAACNQIGINTIENENPVLENKVNFSEIINEEDHNYENLNMGGGIDGFDERFIYAVEALGNEVIAIRGNEVHEWIKNVFEKLPIEERYEMPLLYRVIRDLNISKEEFVAVSKREENSEFYLETNIIDTLFEDNIKEMKKVLVHENALFYDGEIYTWREISNQSIENLSKLGIPYQVLLDFANERLSQFEETRQIWAINKEEANQRYENFMEKKSSEKSNQLKIDQNIDNSLEWEEECLISDMNNAYIVFDLYSQEIQQALKVIEKINSSNLN